MLNGLEREKIKGHRGCGYCSQRSDNQGVDQSFGCGNKIKEVDSEAFVEEEMVVMRHSCCGMQMKEEAACQKALEAEMEIYNYVGHS